MWFGVGVAGAGDHALGCLQGPPNASTQKQADDAQIEEFRASAAAVRDAQADAHRTRQVELVAGHAARVAEDALRLAEQRLGRADAAMRRRRLTEAGITDALIGELGGRKFGEIGRQTDAKSDRNQKLHSNGGYGGDALLDRVDIPHEAGEFSGYSGRNGSGGRGRPELDDMHQAIETQGQAAGAKPPAEAFKPFQFFYCDACKGQGPSIDAITHSSTCAYKLGAMARSDGEDISVGASAKIGAGVAAERTINEDTAPIETHANKYWATGAPKRKRWWRRY